MIYTHVAAVLLGAAIAAAGTWNIQSWRLDGQIDAMRAKHAQELAQAKEDALQAERAISANYQGAINAARVRETSLRRDIAAADSESDGLRAQLSDAARRLADAPPTTVLEYATTVNQLFADCSRGYQELAGKADGHAADVRTLREAWPVTGGATHARHQD